MDRIHYVGMMIGVLGFAWLTYVDWRVALGVFLCMYGNNLTQS